MWHTFTRQESAVRQSERFQRIVAIVQELELTAIEFGRRQAEGGRPNAERQELVRLMRELWETIEPCVSAYEAQQARPQRRLPLAGVLSSLGM